MTDAGVYIRRKVINADAQKLTAWARTLGIPHMPAADLHVTIVYSKEPFDHGPIDSATMTVALDGMSAEHLGKSAALVLRFRSDALESRNAALRAAGASSDFEGYIPHITISYQADNLDPAAIDLSELPSTIRLGPEVAEPITGSFAPEYIPHEGGMMKGVQMTAAIAKVDEDQRLVWGWASVIEEGGKAVVDSQGDVIGEADLLKAAHMFVTDARVGKAMHEGEPVAEVVESMVLTKSAQEALGIDLGKVGWWIAMKVHDDDVWARVKGGELGAFSIGGRAQIEEMA